MWEEDCGSLSAKAVQCGLLVLSCPIPLLHIIDNAFLILINIDGVVFKSVNDHFISDYKVWSIEIRDTQGYLTLF